MNRFFIIIVAFGVALVPSLGRAELAESEIFLPSNTGDSEIAQPRPHKQRIGDRIRRSLFSTHDGKDNRHEEGKTKEPDYSIQEEPAGQPLAESVFLKDIAALLSIPLTEEDTSGDIAFKIEQRLGSITQYRGEVLSDENAQDVQQQILEESDAEIFAAYHAFIKKIAGRRILIVDDNRKE